MYLSIKELQSFYCCSKTTAIMRKQELIDYFELKRNRVSIYHLSKYEDVPVSVICSVVGRKQVKI